MHFMFLFLMFVNAQFMKQYNLIYALVVSQAVGIAGDVDEEALLLLARQSLRVGPQGVLSSPLGGMSFVGKFTLRPC